MVISSTRVNLFKRLKYSCTSGVFSQGVLDLPGFEVSSVLSYQGVSLNTPIFPGQGLFLNQLPVGGWLIFGPSKLFKCSSVQEPVKSKK